MDKLRTLLICTIAFVLCISIVHAQQVTNELPYSFTHKIKHTKATIALPIYDYSTLIAANNNSKNNAPMQFGKGFPVKLTLQNSGTWQHVEKGRIWQLHVESKNAYAITVMFSKYNLPEGAKLFIYNPTGTSVLGALTDKNNKEYGSLATSPVAGSKITIELFEPYSKQGMTVLEINNLVHAFLDIEKFNKGFGDSGACNNNVVCPIGDNHRDQIKSVARMVIDGSFFCSGALINNVRQDGTPYFLTANHCMSAPANTIVFRFNYESPTCSSNTNGPSTFQVSGSTLKASSNSSDYALLELSSTPSAAFQIYYSGWDRSDLNPTNQVGIHHPSGDVKKISIDNQPATKVVISGPTQTWEVGGWEDGTTEGGSSGSPLFDQNNRIIGQLNGGLAACGNNDEDYYGRFAIDMLNGASTFLDPDNTGALTLDGYDPNAIVAIKEKTHIQVEIYPNPSNTNMSIAIENEEQIESIQVLNVLGKLIFSEYGNVHSKTNIDVSTWPAGIYLVNINNSISKKVIIQH